MHFRQQPTDQSYRGEMYIYYVEILKSLGMKAKSRIFVSFFEICNRQIGVIMKLRRIGTVYIASGNIMELILIRLDIYYPPIESVVFRFRLV